MVDIKNKGGLNYATLDVFTTQGAVEGVLKSHFDDPSIWGAGDAFAKVIDAISDMTLHPLFCDSHRKDAFPALIMAYVQMRFIFETDSKNAAYTNDKAAALQANRKLKNLGKSSATAVKSTAKEILPSSDGLTEEKKRRAPKRSAKVSQLVQEEPNSSNTVDFHESSASQSAAKKRKLIPSVTATDHSDHAYCRKQK